MPSIVMDPDDNHQSQITWHSMLALPNSRHLCIICKVFCARTIKKGICIFGRYCQGWQTSGKDKYFHIPPQELLNYHIHKSFTSIQYAWALSTMKPLKSTFKTPFACITTSRFYHKIIWACASANCILQQTM